MGSKITSNKKCNANDQVLIYNKTDRSPIKHNETNHMLNVMDCYYLDDGMKVQPDVCITNSYIVDIQQ